CYKKVSLAEQLTDISDSENARKTRKSRARIQYSDNSDSEGHPPKKRSKRTGSTGKKAIRSDIQYPEIPSVYSINRSPFTSIKNDNAILTKRNVDTTIVQEKNTSLKASDIRDTSTDIHHTLLTNNEKIDYLIDNAKLTKRNVDTTIVQEKNPTKACYIKETLIDTDHTFFTTNEKIDYLIELQKLCIKKENLILVKINDLQRFNDMNKSGHIDRNTVNDKMKVTKLYYRGGKNIDDIVNKIMSLIFTNSLACSYSYFGKQKKKSFNNLVLCKCVLDAIYRHKLHVKEDYIIKKIGFWLAQSPTRQAREKLKKENSESKTETKDTDVLVPSASESD
ncbi:uncharacterized protein, partial [Temnothorax nylanderi]|uniref:uncharacterized protein n=1 Tax=Temnothorax nylanderi TaxID=102681 RepID=UPI003A86E48B